MASLNNAVGSFAEEPTVQKAYTIGGVPIVFPYKAYPSQITMMDKIIKCLNKKQNCLLESPTGSGKSLALLCAALAWLKKTTKEFNESEIALNKHLNAHGVALADSSKPYGDKLEAIIQKFTFSKYNKLKNSEVSERNVEPTNKNGLSQNDNLLETASSVRDKDNDASESSPSNQIVVDKEENNELKIKSSPNLHCRIKKRGIVFTDNDDLEDFQPVKKNKLFIDTPSVSEDTNLSQNSEFPTQDRSIPTSSGAHNVTQRSTSDSDHESKVKSIPANEENTIPNKLPIIYFGTRTHKQIAQIIRELKKTPYKDVKMTILSSRERTCIHPKNSRSRNKNEGCDELINREEGPSCKFYINIKRVCHHQPMEMSSAFDLEDFVSICRRKQVCPYFGAREMLPFSEIVFCPYNYLVDPLIRSALSISLKGNIVIMDEAHNIEDSAREAASSKFSVHQLQEAIADILQIGHLKEQNSEPYMHLGKVLENLKKWMETSQNLTDYVTFDSSSKVWSGDEMIAVLDYVGLGPDTFPIFQSKYSKICRDESETDKEKAAESKDFKLSGITHMCLKSLTETLNYMYKDKLAYVPDYRCVVMKSKTFSDDKRADSHSKRMSFTKLDFEIAINFWCLNPAVAFSDMKNVHSIVVASGTLAPLTSFQSELGIPFQINLEANHVIRKEQIWIGTIGRGPSNNSLNANYKNASTFAFQDDIGNLVLHICSVIPHGVLCFLPSYGMLDKLASRWHLTGLWDKLLCKKVVLCEPRRANEDFQQVIQDFYDAVKDSETGNIDAVGNGALLFAVCRGKVSEGIDFADNYARAVITIGIPFPNVKDAQVDLKKKYNDIHSSKRQIVTGSAWYEMQAFRALNQALGRCIRHRNDFGALIMVDERFQKNDRYIAALSKWIGKEVCHYSTFHDALSSLHEFADKMGLKDRTEMD